MLRVYITRIFFNISLSKKIQRPFTFINLDYLKHNICKSVLCIKRIESSVIHMRIIQSSINCKNTNSHTENRIYTYQ